MPGCPNHRLGSGIGGICHWQKPVSGMDRLPQGLRQGAPPLAVVCVTSQTSPCIPSAIDGKGHGAMEDQTRYTHALQRGCDLIVCFMK